jgi:prepilin-type N-terminal cleavage/methylation domain-containing protein
VVTNSCERGFSLVELLMVVAIMGVMFGLASGVTTLAVRAAKADGSTTQVTSILELARNQATSERRDFQVTFTAPNRIQVVRLNQPSGSTVIATRFLEGELAFTRFTGPPDTPDLFGGTGAIAFGSTPIRFTSDGSLINDSTGDVMNGTLFLGVPSRVETARAVTIFGATGLIRTWKWNGAIWAN